MNKTFKYAEDRLTPSIAISIAKGKIKGILTDSIKEKIVQSSKSVEHILDKGKPIYGINTGFGVLCKSIISKQNAQKLQYNLLRSHACGVGTPAPPLIAKLMLINKVQSLSYGYSGISLKTLERIIWHIDNDIIPVVPQLGSVGASGDLAPLAHLFLPLIGEGSVYYDNKNYEASKVLNKFGLKPLTLHPKEGLALINGTQFMSAFGVYGIDRFQNCLEHADIISAVTIEALKGSIKPFDYRLHDLRPYRGSKFVAKKVFNLLRDSEIVRSHANCSKVQDPYSLRCIPQVHGAAWEAFLHYRDILTTELNSVTDNPVIINKDTVISGGNFHGEPIALPTDYASLAASEIGNISDRRIYLLLKGDDELPKMLLPDVGINSGFMIPQYVSAALASENKGLTFPASADSIPTSLGQEDHVSMGSIAVRKFNTIIDNLEYILSIELLLSFQGLEFRRPLRSTNPIEEIFQYVRETIPFADKDRIFSTDINKAKELLKTRKIVEIVDNYLNLEEYEKKLFGVYWENN